jgi:hypothetical protein
MACHLMHKRCSSFRNLQIVFDAVACHVWKEALHNSKSKSLWTSNYNDLINRHAFHSTWAANTSRIVALASLISNGIISAAHVMKKEVSINANQHFPDKTLVICRPYFNSTFDHNEYMRRVFKVRVMFDASWVQYLVCIPCIHHIRYLCAIHAMTYRYDPQWK